VTPARPVRSGPRIGAGIAVSARGAVPRPIGVTIVPGADASLRPDVASVLSAASEGEHWALTALFRAYQPALVRYLRAQEPGVADDLAGEVWVAVARGLSGFSGNEVGFRAWLFTIARRRLIEHRRKAVRRQTDPVPHDRLDLASETGVGADPAGLVLDQLSAQEAIGVVVGGLSPDQAEAVLLRVVAGFEVSEVSRIMGRSAGSVRVLCHRALRRLAERLPEGVLAE
jgi:RNA polymerase sigma-70 factor, ECF subfamily